MNIRPDASELLAIARQTLLSELLPQLPDSLRYKALMVANAMAIAGRECRDGECADAVEAQLLAALLDDSEASLTDARQALCQAIRQGRFDEPGPDQDRLFPALSAITRARLSISNPKALGQ
ncbi:hypothetical protein D3C87_1330530 [compost metagenome]|jgi:hypothetical protein|uniref:DUF6285 domain-containing protein n=1 Tax=Pseudomonas fluorescens TaxID=294 RepID=A0A5E7T5Q0_PSEFL|nr:MULTISPECIES: DUF6285 domain-containing protein [Pseudomonas]QCY11655.1 acyl-CoA dehydrogenase [Pseudomonas sp. MPC6]VVP93440.1 hypothetical protein PS928_01871 [Pseudomonas fluorescens]